MTILEPCVLIGGSLSFIGFIAWLFGLQWHNIVLRSLGVALMVVGLVAIGAIKLVEALM